jgi:hypothetical protein
VPTIAQIIAAKQAGAAAAVAAGKPVTYAAATAPTETLAERAATIAAIDRIDPPGKQERATSARKSAGLILSKDLPGGPEARGQQTPIRGPEDEPRSLSATEGEAIPMVPVTATATEQSWHAALNAFESELCLMTDPKDPERAWIAVRLDGQEEWPILLKSFPLYQHPRTARPPNEPF